LNSRRGFLKHQLLVHYIYQLQVLKDALKNSNDKNKLECNREILSACIYIATSATENNNTRVRSVNIRHFAINFDISFDNGSDEDMFD